MKRILMIMIVLFAFMLPIKANAEREYPEIKEFKNKIAYGIDGKKLTDMWAYKMNDDGTWDKFYQLDKAGKVINTSDTYPDVEVQEDVYGYIEFKSEGLDDFPYTITVYMTNHSTGDGYVVNLYKANNFRLNETYPIGTYTIQVGVENDNSAQYRFDFPATITVYDTKTATPCLIKPIEEETVVDVPEETTAPVQEEVVQEEETDSGSNVGSWILVFSIPAVLFGYSFYKKRKK